MHIEHSVPSARSPEFRLQPESTAELELGSIAKAKMLLSELRHLLENGCTLSTALDALDEAQAAVLALEGESAPLAPKSGEIERLDLLHMLNHALDKAGRLIAQTGTVVLNRNSRTRFVRARRHELETLLDEVIHVAVQSCANTTGLRILRVRIHNEHRGHPRLFVEHSGDCAAPSEPIKCMADGIEVCQDHARCTIALTFHHRAFD